MRAPVFTPLPFFWVSWENFPAKGCKILPIERLFLVFPSPSQWWHFAIQSHLERIRDNNRRRTWKFCLERSRNNVQYVEAYLECLTKGSGYMLYKNKVLAHIHWKNPWNISITCTLVQASTNEWSTNECSLLKELSSVVYSSFLQSAILSPNNHLVFDMFCVSFFPSIMIVINTGVLT